MEEMMMDAKAVGSNGMGDGSDYMIQRKIEIMMDINNKKIANELNRITSMISSLNSDISDIKRRINGAVPQQSAGFVVGHKVEHREPSVEKQASLTKVNEGQASRPRYGDYKPEDVDINKFFYFGNKK